MRLPWRLLAAAATLAAAAAEAEARPGGGHSYSGGGSSGGGGFGGGSSSGGDAGTAILYLVVQLCMRHPAVGVPLLVVLVAGYAWFKHQTGVKKSDAWDSTPTLAPPPPVDLDGLRRFDPRFSAILFEDFVYRLFAAAHGARTDAARLAELAPYLGEEVRRHLAAREPIGQPVSGVVIGSMSVTRLQLPQLATDAATGAPQYAQVLVRFEANMTCGEGRAARTYYVVESWCLVRAATAVTRDPEHSRALRCPNCAAPFSSSDEHRCDHCGEIVDSGLFDWLVTRISPSRIEARPPALVTHVEETGTYGPSRVHPGLGAALESLRRDDPGFDEGALLERVGLVYAALNAAWNAQDLAPVRPYVSDNLCAYLQYWIDAYRSEGLRNVLADARIESHELCRVSRDAHYDAITIRLWAVGHDYTERGGRVVGGSKTEPRHYSEYWTFLRGAAVRGAPRTDQQCPNCGAPLKISMAGSCEYCTAHVTSGEFDWVLGKIEQD